MRGSDTHVTAAEHGQYIAFVSLLVRPPKGKNCKALEHECENTVSSHGGRGGSKEFEVGRFSIVDVRTHAEGCRSINAALSAALEGPRFESPHREAPEF